MDNQVSPPPNTETLLMDFPAAIREVINGNPITRFSFDPARKCYGLLADGKLTIHMDNEFHAWLVNDGDLEANDWMLWEGNKE